MLGLLIQQLLIAFIDCFEQYLVFLGTFNIGTCKQADLQIRRFTQGGMADQFIAVS
ncbi:hypothetical protein [Aliamphritea spongicola]|nr:hypothetical protein [Aliamphritea spongicola]